MAAKPGGSGRLGNDPDWSPSWAKPLWKMWLGLAGTIAGLSLALFGIFDRTTLSANAWKVLSTTARYPVSWIVLAALAAAFATSAAFILLLQVADRRRVSEAETRLKTCHDEVDVLTEKNLDISRRMKDATRDYENLEGLFRDRERLRMLDHITGIPNYQSWEEDLRRWASRGRTEKEFSLILIDLDNLKWLNDRSRDCADQVLRFFARRTYESMRRDEQLYKAPELSPASQTTPNSVPAPEMYRHYQGGDEFFFIVSGDVYGAVGFVNRLADRVQTYAGAMDDEILSQYLDAPSRAAFRLSFSAVIAAIHPGAQPDNALPNAYSVLGRAKQSPHSRLLVVFEDSYETPQNHRVELEKGLARITARLAAGAAVSPAERLQLEESQRSSTINIALLKKSEQLFPPATPKTR